MAKAERQKPIKPRNPYTKGYDPAPKKTRIAEYASSDLKGSRSARVLSLIRRDMDIKGEVMRQRRRNEEILSLVYRDGRVIGSADESQNLRENALNLPYRYARWLESQLTGKKMGVTVSRDAGMGQIAGGVGDETTGKWQSIALERVAYEARYDRELAAVSNEVLPRGTSVMAIGYHEDVINLAAAKEVGKDTTSVVPEVLAHGDTEAKPGQDHAAISAGLAGVGQNPMFGAVAGSDAVAGLMERKASHDAALAEDSTDETPIESTRMIRRRLWMRKKRVGEDCGWSPHVYDIEDAGFWWDRHVDTVAWVKKSDLFTASFKAQVRGYDARNVSGVARGGRTSSTDAMSANALASQGEDVLSDDERFVEWFTCWYRRPDMLSGGIRKIVCAEVPDEFIEADDSNPHVDATGRCAIPGFFPFYDFTPFLSSLCVSERTCGIPPLSVGMTQFEKIAEYNRLRHESALRHSLRLYQIHPGIKDTKRVLRALKNGEDGFAFIADQALVNIDGKMDQGVLPLQFTGNTMEIDRQAAREESDWIKMMGMPPAVLQGVGTAGTAYQDQIGVAAGERESGALVTYFEKRMADVMLGIRGLMRSCYDDAEFTRLLGAEGAAAMKAWQKGSVDDGDMIQVSLGGREQANETVERKQIMEAIQTEEAKVDPVTGLQIFDTLPLYEELHRSLGLGKPQPNANALARLQQLVMALMQKVKQLSPGPAQGGPPQTGGSPSRAGPNPSEGEGPEHGTLAAGAARGTVSHTYAGA